MTRLKALNPDVASGKNKDLFKAIHSKFGVVPNMMRTMGNSPVFLEAYLSMGSALGNGTLGVKVSALLALAIAESNACSYCLSAHTYIGANLAKLDADIMEAARLGNSKDPKIDAILKFAQTLVRKRGHVTDTDVALVRNGGVTDSEICEIIGHVALNTLTNYFNSTAHTEIDFPVVEAQRVAVG